MVGDQFLHFIAVKYIAVKLNLKLITCVITEFVFFSVGLKTTKLNKLSFDIKKTNFVLFRSSDSLHVEDIVINVDYTLKNVQVNYLNFRVNYLN